MSNVGGPGTSGKAGLYFTEDTTKPGGFGETGRYDFGIKGAASDSVSVGPFGVEYEVESNYSVMPAFQRAIDGRASAGDTLTPAARRTAGPATGRAA